MIYDIFMTGTQPAISRWMVQPQQLKTTAGTPI